MQRIRQRRYHEHLANQTLPRVIPPQDHLSVCLFKELSVCQSESFRRAGSSIFGIRSNFQASSSRLDSSPYSLNNSAPSSDRYPRREREKVHEIDVQHWGDLGGRLEDKGFPASGRCSATHCGRCWEYSNDYNHKSIQ